MDIFFCHGLESAPHGSKYRALRDAGFDVIAPDFQGMNLQARVDKLTPLLRTADTPLVVGSSYGGITALCSAIEHTEAGGALTGLVLCAPALARAEPPAAEMELYAPVRTIIIHGTGDDIIPIEISRRFAAAHDQVELIEVDDGHRLANSRDLIVDAVRRFTAAA